MKRLTISMSDELFSKLDTIENKSLFIRKLIERELDMPDNLHDIDSRIPWERDIASLKGHIDELFTRLSDIESELTARVMQENIRPATRPGPVATGQDEQPESPDENGPFIPKQTPEDKYAFLVRENTSTDPRSDPDIEPSAEEVTVLPETEHAPGTGQKDLTTIPERPLVPEIKPPMETQQESAPSIPDIKPSAETGEEKGWVMPELKPPAGILKEQTMVMPELRPPVQIQQEQTVVMPELEPPAGMKDTKQTSLPDSKPPFETDENVPFIMPEFDKPEGAAQAPPFITEEDAPFENNDQAFTMPELKPPAETKGTGTFKIPDLQPETMPPFEAMQQQNSQPEEKQPLFKIHDIPSVQQDEKQPPFIAPAFPEQQHESASIPPFENSELNVDPLAQQPAIEKTVPSAKNDSFRSDKLASNILMYMPHGAKVKKGIIKSLISKQFIENDIDGKLAELVSAGILKLTAEGDDHYLIRP
ncbi:hypothetical protein [Methanolobus halotolerans]|uniref:Uncharacterized protein n=1 Tax=Methanolobus halotolerans TaxID=2052935 RepID=A0A4E0PV99_9EURY|nr:hypothetical protein [Methanolobus halotolerans]TGC07876.1 hypothetical protein CUN85_10550 [Methanolobus halotolerans]